MSTLTSTTTLTRAERSEQTADLTAQLSTTSDPAAQHDLRDRVVVINIRIAEALARRYENRGIPDDDLRQVACEGLTKAVARFDPAQGHDFLTFAVPTIRGEIQRYFRDRGWTVRPPRKVQEIQWHALRVTDDLEHQLGREPTLGEVAAAIDVPLAELEEAMTASGCFTPTSLDVPRTTGDGGQGSIGDLLSDDDSAAAYDAAEARATLVPVLRRLSERDRRIIQMRYAEDLTQAEIGAEIGVTQMQVSRLLARILKDLREGLEDPAV